MLEESFCNSKSGVQHFSHFLHCNVLYVGVVMKQHLGKHTISTAITNTPTADATTITTVTIIISKQLGMWVTLKF